MNIFNSPIVRFFLVFILSVTGVSLTTYANDSAGLIEGGTGVIYVITIFSTILYASWMGELDSKLVITSHWSRVVYRFLLLTFIPGILAIQHHEYTPLLLAFSAYTVFYLVFESVYDNEKHLGIGYVGTTAINDKIINWLNKNTFLGWIYPVWYIGLKLILIIFSQLLVFKYFIEW